MRGIDHEQRGFVDTRIGQNFRPNPEVLVQPMEDTFFLLHRGTDRFYELNRTAARLWELLSAGYTLSQIQVRMLGEFDVDETQLSCEIKDLLSLMKTENLIVKHE
jgi:hypothetical protein